MTFESILSRSISPILLVIMHSLSAFPWLVLFRVEPRPELGSKAKRRPLGQAEWVEIGHDHVASTQRQKSLDGKKVTP